MAASFSDSDSLESLFAKELALYHQLDDEIALYLKDFSEQQLSTCEIIQKDITDLYDKQIEKMRQLWTDEIFQQKHLLLFDFVKNSLDTAHLEKADPDSLFLCYLSLYKLLQRDSGKTLISSVRSLLKQHQKKIVIHPTEEIDFFKKALIVYVPTHPTRFPLHVVASQSNENRTTLLIPFIALGHEFIHCWHDLSNLKFTDQDFPLALDNPKRWLYVYDKSIPSLKNPREYVTIEGNRDILNGFCENTLRREFSLSLRSAWTCIRVSQSNKSQRNDYYFFTEANTLSSEEITSLLRYPMENGKPALLPKKVPLDSSQELFEKIRSVQNSAFAFLSSTAPVETSRKEASTALFCNIL